MWDPGVGPFPTPSALRWCQGHALLGTGALSAPPRGLAPAPALGMLGHPDPEASPVAAPNTAPTTAPTLTSPCPCHYPSTTSPSAHYPCLSPCPCPCTTMDTEGGREGEKDGVKAAANPCPVTNAWAMGALQWLWRLSCCCHHAAFPPLLSRYRCSSHNSAVACGQQLTALRSDKVHHRGDGWGGGGSLWWGNGGPQRSDV